MKQHSIDQLDTELHEMDFVIFNPPYYKGLKIGWIDKISKTGKTIDIVYSNNNDFVNKTFRSSNVIFYQVPELITDNIKQLIDLRSKYYREKDNDLIYQRK